MSKPDPEYSQAQIHRLVFLAGLKQHSVRVSAPGAELFTLKSGERSRYYFDVKKTAMRGLMHRPLAKMLHAEYMNFPNHAIPDVIPASVAGVALGGCHLASIVAYETDGPVDVVHVRKEAKDHGTKNLIEGPRHSPGEPVILFEDVVTTGGSSLAAIKALEEAGYVVLGIIAVIDRRVEPADHVGNYPLRSLYTLADFQDENLPT